MYRTTGGLHLDEWKVLGLAALLPTVAVINNAQLNEINKCIQKEKSPTARPIKKNQRTINQYKNIVLA